MIDYKNCREDGSESDNNVAKRKNSAFMSVGKNKATEIVENTKVIRSIKVIVPTLKRKEGNEEHYDASNESREVNCQNDQF